MTHFLHRSQTRNSLRTFVGALLVMCAGYAIAFVISDLPRFPQIAEAVSYQGDEHIAPLRPFVAVVAAAEELLAVRPDEPIHIVAVGDIMLDRGVKYIVGKAGDGDPYFPFAHVRSLIGEADIAFGNLEGPVSDQGNNVGSIYSFRMPVSSVRVLEDIGFDVLSFANNHVGDWNRAAFIDTLQRFSSTRVALTGAGTSAPEAERPVIRDVRGTRIGFLAFTDVGPNWLKATADSPGILIANKEDIDRIVRRAGAEVDILLVSFHFGEEYQTVSNARQQLLARAAVDAGADAVIGHHPHVGQEVEIYRGAPIAYSLGNFVFDQRFSEDTSKGLVLELDVSDGRVTGHRARDITFNAYFQPIPAWDISTTTR